MSFRIRILAALLLVTYFSVTLFFVISYHSALRALEESYIEAQTRQMRLQLEMLDDRLGSLYRLAVQISLSPSLMEATKQYQAVPAPQMVDVIALNDILQQQIAGSIASQLYFYLPTQQEIICSDELHIRRSVADEADYPWVAAATQSDFSPAFFYDGNDGDTQYYYGYSKPVVDASGVMLGIAYVALDERNLFYELLNRADTESSFLCNGQGTIYSATQRESIGRNMLSLLDGLTVMPDKQACTLAEQLLVSATAPFSDMRLLVLMERRALQSKLNGTRVTFVLLLSGIVLLAIGVAWLMQRWLYRPIDSLIKDMDRAGAGDLRVRSSKPQPLEFQRLADQFNQMVAHIDGLLDSLLEERMAKRQAELRALQYQIRPHFMYNTLNSIKFAAILQGNTKVGEQIGSFVALLEASISKTGAFLTLKEEIALLEHYISLQKYRYMDCFTVIYDIPEEAEACYVPRLLLQPLVENALLHGMDLKRADNEIRVAALVEQDTLWLAVHDNGKGMTTEEQQRLLDSTVDDHRQFTGIGVANIRERLRMYYGKRTQFQLVSAPGMGTSIVLQLPASYDEKEYAL